MTEELLADPWINSAPILRARQLSQLLRTSSAKVLVPTMVSIPVPKEALVKRSNVCVLIGSYIEAWDGFVSTLVLHTNIQ
jgi:hypothetical protein